MLLTYVPTYTEPQIHQGSLDDSGSRDTAKLYISYSGLLSGFPYSSLEQRVRLKVGTAKLDITAAERVRLMGPEMRCISCGFTEPVIWCMMVGSCRQFLLNTARQTLTYSKSRVSLSVLAQYNDWIPLSFYSL